MFSSSFYSLVIYEGGSVMSQARSLWRLELARTKWAGGFINWLHPMRIRHLTTGRYLGVKENNELYLVDRLILIFRKVQGSRRFLEAHDNLLNLGFLFEGTRRRSKLRHSGCDKRRMIRRSFLRTRIWRSSECRLLNMVTLPLLCNMPLRASGCLIK